MTDFPSSYKPQLVKSLPYYISKAWKKVALSGGANPYRPLWGVPGPSPRVYLSGLMTLDVDKIS